MKYRSFLFRMLPAIVFVLISCHNDPQFNTGADCGGCEIPPGGGTVAQSPFINSFNPASGYTPFPNTGLPGTFVTISGGNFSSTPAANAVTFNGTSAVVISATTNQINTSVPTGATTGKIRVTVNNMTATSAMDFTVLPKDTWQQVANFPGIGRSGAVSFVIKNIAYVGTGFLEHQNTTGQVVPSRDFWQYNPKTDTWTQKANLPGKPRGHASGFATGSRGYITLGTDGFAPYTMNDLWEYNPATNSWIQRADFPGVLRMSAPAFTINSKGYLGTGLNPSNGFLQDFWEYDPMTNVWTQKSNFGGAARAFAGGFVINGKGYLGLGQTLQQVLAPDFWEYNPTTNSWVQKASIGSNAAPANSGFFSIGSKGYVGGQNQLWMFDPVANTWVRKADFPDSMTSGVAFAADGFGYIGLGHRDDPTLNHQAFYRYTPD